jgi:hypothetical protein
MKKQIQKDKKIRNLFNQQELYYIVSKGIGKNENLFLLIQ